MKSLLCVFTGLHGLILNDYCDGVGDFSADMFFSSNEQCFVILGMGMSHRYDVDVTKGIASSILYNGELYLSVKDYDYLQRNMPVVGELVRVEWYGEFIKLNLPVKYMGTISRKDYCMLYGYAG